MLSLRRKIERLGPYPSLALLALPIGVVEPMKLIAVAIAGDGHWFTGMIVLVGAYCASLFLTERLFGIVKPKLLKLHWFARLCTRLIMLRYRTISIGRVDS